MDMKPWSHLPNARLIDWVLEHSANNPPVWGNEYSTKNQNWVARIRRIRNNGYGAANRYDAFCAARKVAHTELIESATAPTDTRPNSGDYMAYAAVCMTLVGLVAWDDIDHILNADPEAVELYAGLEVDAAVLLQILHTILHKEKETV